MNIKFYFPVFLSFIFYVSCSKSYLDLNISFEDIENGIPKGWFINAQPGYSVYMDSNIVKTGKYSLVIEFTGDSSHAKSQSVFLSIPKIVGAPNYFFMTYILRFMTERPNQDLFVQNFR